MQNPLVSIFMGSDNDFSIMQEAGDILATFGIPFEYSVTSAHRSPQRTADLVKDAEKRGVKVIIAGAGKAAHLAGFIAAWTTIPVLGVPIDASLGGLDALFSTVQMPAGVPVGAMGIGASGARNAGIFAIQILASFDTTLRERLIGYRGKMALDVERRDSALKESLKKKEA